MFEWIIKIYRPGLMWRHLSIAVVAHKTVVQRMRSNRWRFNFEMAGRGGQINFLWTTAMIIATTKTSILIICPFPRGLLWTHPLSPPPYYRGRCFRCYCIWQTKTRKCLYEKFCLKCLSIAKIISDVLLIYRLIHYHISEQPTQLLSFKWLGYTAAWPLTLPSTTWRLWWTGKSWRTKPFQFL